MVPGGHGPPDPCSLEASPGLDAPSAWSTHLGSLPHPSNPLWGGALCSSGGMCLRTAVGTQIPDVSGGAHWAAYRRDAGPWGEAEEPQATCLLCHQRPLIGELKGQPGMERAGLGLASPTFPGQDRLARPCWDPGEEVAVGSRWKQFLRLGM